MTVLTIDTLMQRHVHGASMDATIAEVEALMHAHKLSWVPVVDPAVPGVAGVISVTDLLHFHAGARDADATRAWQLCTYKPLSVTPGTPIAEVARQMLGRGIHHVVVIDGTRLVGVVSALDFVRRFADT